MDVSAINFAGAVTGAQQGARRAGDAEQKRRADRTDRALTDRFVRQDQTQVEETAPEGDLGEHVSVRDKARARGGSNEGAIDQSKEDDGDAGRIIDVEC